MLQLQVVMSENFNEETNEFVETTHRLRLEHSLVSLSKWESEYEKPFLDDNDKSQEEILAYVIMMDLDEETPLEVFLKLSHDDFVKINEHIHGKKTATWFNKRPNKKPRTQTVTSELLYYWMTSYEIPWEAQTWHLNRLFTLIEVFNEERAAAESKSGNKSVNKERKESMAQERQRLNAERRAALNSTG
ncbi:hypothetical protein PBI_UNTOUCHABLE_25 [Gordonia phage Untouchable]|uniref:Uncharacterized protein n=2 Tax=Kenoshavirus TaxID=2842796 RepID=A0A649V9R2_9CAUD|nr:hypothetical protein HWC79_gp25 [Gordonia phage Untouchable]YP_009853888.1 hypothetical protein HWC81_gp25 [Gordonia phage Crocheter]QGJ89070.1 hypothetical protein PBI_UNTOUCHABLE_25 [Gordonia phage Untouchable]QGJ90371.1 hypothetical protein PBI_CROCHETER_25 [Gordonia phage Crocheter]